MLGAEACPARVRVTNRHEMASLPFGRQGCLRPLGQVGDQVADLLFGQRVEQSFGHQGKGRALFSFDFAAFEDENGIVMLT